MYDKCPWCQHEKCEKLMQIGKAKFNRLEAQLRETEKTLRAKESAIRQLQESFTARIHEMKHQLTEKEDCMFLPRAQWKTL